MEPLAEWRAGTGDWKYFNIPLEQIFEIAAGWKSILAGLEKPWLCWNVSPRWSVPQQKLVLAVGWTPIVGFDPRVGPPPIVDGSILLTSTRSYSFPCSGRTFLWNSPSYSQTALRSGTRIYFVHCR